MYRANILYSHLFIFEVTLQIFAFYCKLYKIHIGHVEIIFLSGMVIAAVLVIRKLMHFFKFYSL